MQTTLDAELLGIRYEQYSDILVHMTQSYKDQVRHIAQITHSNYALFSS